MANEDKNVRLANMFRVDIDGIEVGAFEECEISDSEYGVIENRTGVDPNRMTVSNGIQKIQTITLGKVARSSDNAIIKLFADWHAAGDTDKRGGSVDYLDKEGNSYHREVFEDGICNKFTAPKLDATAEEKAMFRIVITAPKTEVIGV